MTQKHFPDPVKAGNTFLFWCLGIDCNEKYDSKATSITNVTVLYAVWTINNYTITFDFGNGTTESKTYEYNKTIDYPVNPAREGFAFNRWKPKPEAMPAQDTTVVAQWTVNTSSNLVEIVIGKKNITKEDAEKIIKGITDENFVIDRIEEDKSTGETIVIIRFDGAEGVKSFVNAVEASGNSDMIIRIIGFSQESLLSLSPACKPFFSHFSVLLFFSSFNHILLGL